MKTTLVSFVLLLLAGSALGVTDEPTKIIEEYREKAATACAKINTDLQNEGAVIAAQRAAAGDSAGALEVSQQIEAKLQGEPVPKPNVALGLVFLKYDTARAAALKPVKDASIKRIDAILKPAGRDMKTILALAKVREEIAGDKAATPATLQAKGKMPMNWEYYSSPDMRVLNGDVTLLEDGSLELRGPPGTTSLTQGKWELTKANTLSATLEKGGAPLEAPGTIKIKGKTAIWERAVGTRYLKAKD